MNLAFQTKPSSIGGSGNYRVRSPYSSSSSSGTYHPSPEDFIASFYAVMRRWESETAFLSDPDQITAHPGYRALVSNAKLVAPLIIEELKTAPSFLVWVLDDAFEGDRPYSEQEIGDIEAMTNAWLAWWERNGSSL